jgi:uncharacterized phage protein (TIGR01671 family)
MNIPKYKAWDYHTKSMRNVIGLYYENDKLVMVGLEFQETGILRLVREVELLEYTGIMDMDEKEVCEGDIMLNTFLGDLWQVDWNVKEGCWRISLIHDTYDDMLCVMSDFRVVGNIYENPEMLIKK